MKHNPMKPTATLLAILVLTTGGALFAQSLAPDVCAIELHVSPTGDDNASGAALAPFATLGRAQKELRALRKVGNEAAATVWLEDGTHRLSSTLDIGAEDSGVTWRARHDGKAVLDAARSLQATSFTTSTDPRLLPEALGQVVQFDLAAAGVKHAGPFPIKFNDGGGMTQLFLDDDWQPVSRWPDTQKARMVRVLDRGHAEGKAPWPGSFVYEGDRPARWKAAADAGQLWLAGFWRVAWEWQSLKVATLDIEKNAITFAAPVSLGIGSKYAGPHGTGTEPWIAVNLVEELSRPGEWAVDFAKQTLFWWPPRKLEGARVSLADFDGPIVRLKGASRVILRGLVVRGALGNGIEITDGADCVVAGCTLTCLGKNGIVVKGGLRHRIQSCDLHTLGHGGILLGGGDRATLTPCGHIADNNHIHDYALAKKVYAPGIGVGFRDQPAPAVGCVVTHNLIHHAPHAAILYGGNDHLFELNEIHDFLIESDDLGGFYSTYDWTSYGNTVRHNFIHDTPHALGIYLDDGDSGDLIEGNIAYRMATCATSGGGHDNTLRGNLAIECKRGVAIDARGVSRGYATNETLLKILAAMNVAQPPWRDRFPTLAAIAENHPALPIGCLLESNVAVNCAQAVHLHGRPEELRVATIRDNVALPIEDLGFADVSKLDFRMSPEAEVFKKVPGFKAIPFEKIGLYVNELRLSLPAHPSGHTTSEWHRP